MDATIVDKKENLKLKNSPNLPRPVRIVANIRQFTPEESNLSSRYSKPWIVIHKPVHSNLSSQGVTISFPEQSTSRKDSYELDYCYEQNEGNSIIYSKELEPLIPEVINGRDLTVIAYGARWSGKTYTVKGTEDDPGLALLAMRGILSKAEEIGYSVSMSMYEVCHEHVVDVLDANRNEVQVLEDAQGRVNLKGLSKVIVKSMKEFSNLFSSRISSQKEGHHNPLEPKRRPHKGLIVYISTFDDDNKLKITSKMNFVDLAGYEDSRRNNEDGIQITKINKSLYGLFNIIHAINANESRVPYRETKLTRLLKESLTRNNQILMVTCLNPSFCQDTIHTVSLASRSCQSITQMLMDSKKGIGGVSKMESLSSARRESLSSTRRERPTTPFSYAKEQTGNSHLSASKKVCSISKVRARPATPFLYAKEQTGGNQPSASKNPNSISKERKIRNDVKPIKLEQLKSPLGNVSAIKCKPLPSITPSRIISQKKAPEVIPMRSSESLLDEEDDIHVSNDPTPFSSLKKAPEAIPLSSSETSPDEEHDFHVNNDHTPYTSLEKGIDMVACVIPSGVNSEKDLSVYQNGKENFSFQMIGNESPPLSEQIKKISENLKALCASAPSSLKPSVTQVDRDYVEPKTPATEHHVKVEDRFETPINYTPSKLFQQRSSGMKQSLVQEYLKFLNTASKEELKELKGIGEKRSTYILELRETSPEPFKNLDDLEDIGLSAKQIKGMMKNMAGTLFN